MQTLHDQCNQLFQEAAADLTTSLLIADDLFDDDLHQDTVRKRQEAEELLKQKPGNYFPTSELEKAISKRSDLDTADVNNLAHSLQVEMMRD